MQKAIIAFVLGLLSLGTLSAQNLDWLFEYHSPKPEIAQEEINRNVASGMVPLGFDASPGVTLNIVYSLESPIASREWIIHQIENATGDRATVDATMAEFMLKGWIPVDFSIQGTDMAVMFIKNTQFPVAGYTISSIQSPTATKVNNHLSDLTNKGFTPMGLSVTGATIHVLAVKFKVPFPGTFTTLSYPNNGEAFAQGLSLMDQQGFIPWGLGFDRSLVWFIFYKK